MKFKTTDKIKLRAAPGINSPQIGSISQNTIVESDEYAWKSVTLPDGTQGFCAASYLEAMSDIDISPAPSAWHAPIRADKFAVTQAFLAPDPATYPKTGVHPGVDYGTQGTTSVPLYFCADGEVIETGADHQYFGNYFFYYVAEVDRTFAYFHLRDTLPSKGLHRAGEQCGIAGKTGLSVGIHLHLECMKGRKTSADRAMLYTSKAALTKAAEDADAFVRSRL
jgi:murein DD-endopeptidase MepM/ murein hydrolase activator NlpD